MDPIKFSHREPNQLHIDDFPDAIAVVQPNQPISECAELARLALYSHDLTSADRVLDALNSLADFSIRSDLWEFAIVKVTKCFKKSNSRKPLSAETIFGDNALALVCLKYFLSMRDKFIVHDDNTYMQCDVGLIIGAEGKSYSIEKVITPTFQAITLSQENYQNLKLLIAHAKIWIETEYDRLANLITEHYERVGRESLLKFPPMTTTPKMSAEDVHLNRK